MNKRDILNELFQLENVTTKIVYCPNLSQNDLLNVISKSKYSLKELNLPVVTVTKYLKILFPDRPHTTNKVDVWLLSKYLYKECKHCLCVKDLEIDFHSNSSARDGYSAYCKICMNSLTAKTASARVAKYKAAKLLRSPKWISYTERKAITDFYSNCPKGYQVDHILPLQGDNVSGLHVLSNLQYLTIKENQNKYNKYTPL